MAEYADQYSFMMRSERVKKKKKKKKKAELEPRGGMEIMKQLVVQCSIPPLYAASFPPLAVARKLIHTHTSSPFPHPCPHPQSFLHDGHHGSSRTSAMAANPCSERLGAGSFSPSPPPLIINHTCPASSLTLQQQVLLWDAVASPTKAMSTSPHCHAENDACQVEDSMELDAHSTRYPLSSPSLVKEQVASTSKESNSQRPLTALHSRPMSPDALLPSCIPKSVEEIQQKPSSRSILCSLLAAAEEGAAFAEEILHHFRESLLSILPQSIRSKISDDWDSIVSSGVIEQYSDKMISSFHSLPLWLRDTSQFKRVIKKMKQTQAHQYNGSIEDLLRAIESFERAGLVDEIRGLGFGEEACVLRDRIVLYRVFARLRVLQEVDSLLCYMRSRMHLPCRDTWSLACLDARYRNCLKRICIVCNFPDNIKTFAWKLDKLELCANGDSCKMYQGPSVAWIANRITKLLDSPLRVELEGLRIISYLDTAVSLLLHHIGVMESLHEHGFGEACGHHCKTQALNLRST